MMYTFRIDGERLRARGVSFGYGDADPWLIARGVRYAIIREPGATDWSQVGSTSYYPTKWYLVEAEITPQTLRVIRVVREEQPGTRWRRTKTTMLEEMERLEKTA